MRLPGIQQMVSAPVDGEARQLPRISLIEITLTPTPAPAPPALGSGTTIPVTSTATLPSRLQASPQLDALPRLTFAPPSSNSLPVSRAPPLVPPATSSPSVDSNYTSSSLNSTGTSGAISSAGVPPTHPFAVLAEAAHRHGHVEEDPADTPEIGIASVSYFTPGRGAYGRRGRPKLPQAMEILEPSEYALLLNRRSWRFLELTITSSSVKSLFDL
jgi:hypothetical protein